MTVVLGKAPPDGRVSVPRDIRRAAGLKPGDAITFESPDLGTVVIPGVPTLRLVEAIERTGSRAR